MRLQPSPGSRRATSAEESRSRHEIHAHQDEAEPRVSWKQRAGRLDVEIHRKPRGTRDDAGVEGWFLDRPRVPIAANQRRDRPSLDEEYEERPTDRNDRNRQQKRREHRGTFHQGRGNGRGHLTPLEGEERSRLAPDCQRHQEYPAEDGRRE